MGQSSNKLIYGVVLFVVAMLGVLIVANRPAAKPPAPDAQQPASDLTPDLPAPQQLENGIRLYDVHLMRAGVPMELWAYLPNPLPSGKLPCVLIAPAGSRLFHGMSLDVGDRVEHLPYVRRGFAVVAYQLDGKMQDRPTDAQGGMPSRNSATPTPGSTTPPLRLITSTRRFRRSTQSESTRWVIAPLALWRFRSPRTIRGSRPASPSRQRAILVPFPAGAARIGNAAIRFVRFFVKLSPDQNIDRLKCPTMLFTAADDRNVPTESVVAFATQLRHTNAHVKLVQVPTGGHYNSMIKQGIPAAIEWLGQLQATRESRQNEGVTAIHERSVLVHLRKQKNQMTPYTAHRRFDRHQGEV